MKKRYIHHKMFELGADQTKYKKLTHNHVKLAKFEGNDILKVMENIGVGGSIAHTSRYRDSVNVQVRGCSETGCGCRPGKFLLRPSVRPCVRVSARQALGL